MNLIYCVIHKSPRTQDKRVSWTRGNEKELKTAKIKHNKNARNEYCNKNYAIEIIVN